MIIFRFLCSLCRGRGLEVKSFKKIDARDRASRKTKRSNALLVAPRSYAPHTLLLLFCASAWVLTSSTLCSTHDVITRPLINTFIADYCIRL